MNQSVFVHDVETEERIAAWQARVREKPELAVVAIGPDEPIQMEFLPATTYISLATRSLLHTIATTQEQKITDERVLRFISDFDAAKASSLHQVWRYLEQKTAPFPGPVPPDPVDYMQRANFWLPTATCEFVLAVAYGTDEWIVYRRPRGMCIIHVALPGRFDTPRVLCRLLRRKTGICAEFVMHRDERNPLFEFNIRYTLFQNASYYGRQDAAGAMHVIRISPWPLAETDRLPRAALMVLWFRFMLQYYDSYYHLHYTNPTPLGPPARLSNELPFLPPLIDDVEDDVSVLELVDTAAKAL